MPEGTEDTAGAPGNQAMTPAPSLSPATTAGLSGVLPAALAGSSARRGDHTALAAAAPARPGPIPVTGSPAALDQAAGPAVPATAAGAPSAAPPSAEPAAAAAGSGPAETVGVPGDGTTGAATTPAPGGDAAADPAPLPDPAASPKPAPPQSGSYVRTSDPYARAAPQADPATQLAPAIAHGLSGDRRVVSVQLHPAELGMVQIRVVAEPDRRVRAVLSAARPETVELLQRHAQGIERALTASGLSLAGTDALSFDLGTSAEQGDQRPNREQGERPTSPGTTGTVAPAVTQPAPAALRQATGLFDLVL